MKHCDISKYRLSSFHCLRLLFQAVRRFKLLSHCRNSVYQFDEISTSYTTCLHHQP